jgi:hypothetical protein
MVSSFRRQAETQVTSSIHRNDRASFMVEIALAENQYRDRQQSCICLSASLRRRAGNPARATLLDQVEEDYSNRIDKR